MNTDVVMTKDLSHVDIQKLKQLDSKVKKL